jgi:hypothetical protein
MRRRGAGDGEESQFREREGRFYRRRSRLAGDGGDIVGDRRESGHAAIQHPIRQSPDFRLIERPVIGDAILPRDADRRLECRRLSGLLPLQ